MIVEQIQERLDGLEEDIRVIYGDAAIMKRIGMSVSVLIDGLVFFSLARRSDAANAQLSVLDVILCGISLLGTVMFLLPHRKYRLANNVVISVWDPNEIGRELFCYSNPLAILILLNCSPRIFHSLFMHLSLALAVTGLCTALVHMYERLLVHRSALAAGAYNSLESFLYPLAFKPCSDAATQTD